MSACSHKTAVIKNIYCLFNKPENGSKVHSAKPNHHVNQSTLQTCFCLVSSQNISNKYQKSISRCAKM